MKKNQINPSSIHGAVWLSSLLVIVVALVSCGGCRSGKSIEIIKITDTLQIKNDQIASTEDTTTQVWQDQHYYRDTKIPLPDSLKGKQGLGINYHHGNPALINNAPRYIYMLSVDDSNVDEYNVQKQILVFKNPKTLDVIKTINLVKENPYHKMGLKRREEPYPAVYYFLIPEGKDTKQALRKFLPQALFKEIPDDFEMDRAISKIFMSATANKYVTVSYELDWLPDAYSDQGEWDGPGYGVHYVVVFDSLGNKIYSRQFDGTSVRPSVSEDGKYLFTMACLSPEWDENIRYRFTVVNIQKDKVVYEDLIENCKKHGGGGDFYQNFYNSNGYYAVFKNNNVQGFMYTGSNLYKYTDELKFEIKTKSINQLLLTYPNGKTAIVNIDSLYHKINLN